MLHDPDELVTVTTAASQFEAGAIVAVLADAGIEAREFSLAAGVTPGVDDPIKVMARARDLEAARAALDRNRADSVDIDWSEVDVGVGESDTVPAPAIRSARPASRVVLALGVMVLVALILIGLINLLTVFTVI